MPANTNDQTYQLPDKIEFLSDHRPAMELGEYVLSYSQKVESLESGTHHKIPEEQFGDEMEFSIQGERFQLSASMVHGVFPPPSSLGDHFNVLPHVILERTTLPWERPADQNMAGVPWLALFLFDEDEKPEPLSITLADLMATGSYPAKFPSINLERSQSPTDRLTAIDVDSELVTALLPATEELKYLAHVRQGKSNGGDLVGHELAVIIGNRLPASGKVQTVHLVSLENRYVDGDFDYDSAGPGDKIRFVSLWSWEFSCLDHRQSFKGILTSLDQNPAVFRMPAHANPAVEKHYAEGVVGLPHFLRGGGKTASWYHGPLIPGPETAEFALPVLTADQLLMFNPEEGIFDAGFAAAWELGRQLTLAQKAIALELFRWKGDHKRCLRRAEQAVTHPHLPGNLNAESAPEVPAILQEWFDGLRLLQGIPFQYLVPHEDMLPVESIRFFHLDSLWLDCLVDGAFSIGRVTSTDRLHDGNHHLQVTASPHGNLTGFILRSRVVSDWPGLIVDAYDGVDHVEGSDPPGNKLEILRMTRLGPDVLLCIFSGEVKTLDLHQKPETIHFGLDENDQSATGFEKSLRDADGHQRGKIVEAVPFRSEGLRVIDVQGFVTEMGEKLSPLAMNGALYAMEMIEGVELVRFKKSGN